MINLNTIKITNISEKFFFDWNIQSFKNSYIICRVKKRFQLNQKNTTKILIKDT